MTCLLFACGFHAVYFAVNSTYQGRDRPKPAEAVKGHRTPSRVSVRSPLVILCDIPFTPPASPPGKVLT